MFCNLFSGVGSISEKLKDNEVVSLGVQEQAQIRIAKAIRQETVEKLWEITEKLNILYKDNWTALAEREMIKFQTLLLEQKTEQDSSNDFESESNLIGKMSELGGGSEKNKGSTGSGSEMDSNAEHNGKKAEEWSFASSFLYSLTLITTVGKPT